MRAKTFIFKKFDFNPQEKRADFFYEITFKNRPTLEFRETLLFPLEIDLKNIPEELLKTTLESVHLMLGISYYKLYCPKKIETNYGLAKDQTKFWNKVYEKGLGEFFYRNNIDYRGLIKFPFEKNTAANPVHLKRKERALVGIGGGKDSIVVAELMKRMGADISAFILETQRKNSIVEKVVEKMEIGSKTVLRILDEKIFEKYEGAYNGHVPVSGVFAFVGYMTALLYDYEYVVVGNEYSSNFGNIEYLGSEINHQWSKSQEFETLFQDHAKKYLSPDIKYFSALRNFHEIKIVELFTKYPQYFSIFTSCNRSFRINKERPESLWCGECPKCIFMFLLLSAFLPKEKTVQIFAKNLYQDETLLPLFKDVLSFGKMKPFDCVGTFDEAQVALFMAHEKYKDDFIMKELFPLINQLEEKKKIVFMNHNAPTLPPKFKFLGIKKVLILGYGKEGKVTEKYLKQNYPWLEIENADRESDPDYLDKQEFF